MKQVTVSVDMNGKMYLTNVIASQDTSHQEILEKAKQQVKKQWME